MVKKSSFTPKHAHMLAELNLNEGAATENSLLLSNAIRIAQDPCRNLNDRASFLALLTQLINSLDHKNDGNKCEEIRKMELLCDECDVIFECKTCRELFRSFEQFSQHKDSASCSTRSSDTLALKENLPDNQELNLNKEPILALFDQFTTARMNRVAEVTESYERPRRSQYNGTHSRTIHSSYRRAKSQKTSALVKSITTTSSKPNMVQNDSNDNAESNAQLNPEPTSAECPICYKKLRNFNGVRRHLLSVHSTSVKKVKAKNNSAGVDNFDESKDSNNVDKPDSAVVENKTRNTVDSMKANLSTIINQSNNGSSEENVSSVNYSEEILENENYKAKAKKPTTELKSANGQNLLQNSTESDSTRLFNHPFVDTREHDYCGVNFSANLLASNREKLKSAETARQFSQAILDLAVIDHFL